MDQDEVTIYDYEDILEYGVDVTGVVAIGNTYCMITNLLANISIVQTDNGELFWHLFFTRRLTMHCLMHRNGKH